MINRRYTPPSSTGVLDTLRSFKIICIDVGIGPFPDYRRWITAFPVPLAGSTSWSDIKDIPGFHRKPRMPEAKLFRVTCYTNHHMIAI